MLQHLKHNEIDKEKWNQTTTNAENGLIYNHTIYLDAVSPNWEALILGDYKAIFPLPVKKKFGIKYLVQPNFLQKLAVVGENIDTETEQLFFDYLKRKYWYFNLRVEPQNKDLIERYFQSENTNFELLLNKPYEKLRDEFSKHHKTNLKKASKKNLQMKEFNDSKLFWELTSKSLQQKMGNTSNKLWEDMYTIINELSKKQMGKFFSVVDDSDDLCAIAFLAFFKNRWYLLFSTTSQTGRKKKAFYVLLDNIISSYADKNQILDFEGSNIESIAYFNKGFGATKTNYYSFKMNKLPWPIKLFLSKKY